MTVVLFAGGPCSGKSGCAERYAAEEGRRIVYVATAEAGDDEMRERIARHQQRRPADWELLEVTSEVGAVLDSVASGSTVLLDSLTLLMSNLLLLHEDDPEPYVERELANLLAAARKRDLALIVLSDEVGMGIVPESPLGRRFRDLLGRATQQVAAVAAEVYLVVAGIPVGLRQLAAQWAQIKEWRHDSRRARPCRARGARVVAGGDLRLQQQH